MFGFVICSCYTSPPKKNDVFLFFAYVLGRLLAGLGEMFGDTVGEICGTCLEGFWMDFERCLDSCREGC